MDAEVPSLAADRALLQDAVRKAGATALTFFGNAPRQWTKGDNSPVSEADIATDTMLHDILTAARPHYGWISEERDEVVMAERTFVVDPIDGTRAYLRGERIWSVVAAIIEDGRPVAAAIAAPVDGTLYSASRGGGADRNGTPIAVSEHDTLGGAEVAMPAALYREGGLQATGMKRAPVLPSLALRLAKVAEGRFDGVVTKGGAHHWDLAAADLIIVEAGGMLCDLSGALPRYDAGQTRHGPLVAASFTLAESLRTRAAAGFATVAQSG
ncbi:MAG: 3'(2'),5'-bisphosphate nucleotidase CysQ [Pseudomonadota bacterium]